MIKIISGKHGSRLIQTLDGENTRPTSNKIRGAIFSKIGPYFEGGSSLDLFAGSGAFSFEALSRGITNAYLVDNNIKAINIIQTNAKLLDENINLYKLNYKNALNQFKNLKFDLIFLDPPYKMKVIDDIINFISANNMLDEDGYIIVETSKDYELKDSIGKIVKVKESIYGIAKINYFKWGGKNMRTAIYPGTFDPITYGHLDIIKRASKNFDLIIVAIMENIRKVPTFSSNERKEMIEQCTLGLENVKVVVSSGLTVDFAKKNNADVIIRGIRAVADYEYELQQATTNMLLDDSIETIFYVSRPKYSFLSSSVAKEVAINGGDLSKFIPEIIRERVIKKLNN
ncbi:MAG: pantetheine-phosphate adenylyltransferase [Erysipelotrichaceae bacterium]|nr:pantetheine-phosphate adenylyltransferase [Erysipelotrichaceae bacterium]